MNVWNQTSWASVTNSGPHGDLSSKFVLLTKDWHVFQFVPNTSIARLYVSILLTVLQLIPVPPPWNDGHRSREVETLCNYYVFSLPIRRTSLRTFFACPSISNDDATVFERGFSHPGNFSVAPAEVRDSNILISRWVHPKFSSSRNDVGSPRSKSFMNFLHMRAIPFAENDYRLYSLMNSKTTS